VTVCPPEAKAVLQAEPAPPGNFTPPQIHKALTDALGAKVGDQVFEWVAVTYPVWARGGWGRAEAVQKWCRAKGY
jgi:hypothetical protein